MLDYGPYASFAPAYSSEYATMSLAESAQMARTYGSAANAEYASGLAAFVETTHDSLIAQVDNLLDVITGGRHTRLVEETSVCLWSVASENPLAGSFKIKIATDR